MSGLGRTFRRTWKAKDGTIRQSRFWSIGFPAPGKKDHVEATKTESEAKAKKILEERLYEIGRGTFIPSTQKWYFNDMIELMRQDYVRKDNRSWEDAQQKIKPLKDRFEFVEAKNIDEVMIDKYVDGRLAAGYERATINGGLRCLRRMFSLSVQKHKMSRAPTITLLPGENHREDHVEVADFDNLLTKFRDEDVRDLVEFQYTCGWRVSSVTRLEKSDIDWPHETIKLRDTISKNKEPMLLSFETFPRMRDVLLRRKAKARPECIYIFHRQGRQIKNFQWEWARATAQAGLSGLTDHGLCRCAAVNLSRAGVDESTAAKMMNRKTLAIYKLYRIISTRDTEIAGVKLQQYYEAEAEKARKVVSIKEGK